MKAIKTLIFVLSIQMCFAQENVSNVNRQNDPYFPAKGKINVGVMTTFSTKTPPPIVIGDITYGISDKISVAVLGGTTGVIGLYGAKFNAILYEKESFRIHFRMPLIYYPERDGKFLFDRVDKQIMPWILTAAAVNAEWITKKNSRFSVGLGMVETHCVEDMKYWLSKEKPHPAEAMEEEMEQEDFSMNGVNNIIQGSASFPLSEKLTFNAEIVVVMDGFKLSKTGEFRGGFPINPYLSLIYSF